MLRAVQISQYVNKNRNTVLVYAITGPIAEVAEYFALQSLQLNKSIDQLAKGTKGEPLMWLNLQTEFQNGRTPQPYYNLTKTHDGSRYVRDTVQQDSAMYGRVNQQKETEMGKILAMRAMGLDTNQPATRVAAPATPATTPAVAGEPDLADQIAQGIGAPEPQPAEAEPIAAGGEGLND